LSVMALPPVLADAGIKAVTAGVRSADAYRAAVTYDWGGVLYLARWIAVLIGLLGLVGTMRLLMHPSVNPSRRVWIAVVTAVILGTSFFYFKYSHEFRHWIFIVASLPWTAWFLLRADESESKKPWVALAALTLAGFGVSYISLLYQIMWFPFLVRWIRRHDRARLIRFGWYCGALLLGMAALVAWAPDPYLRLWRMSRTEGYRSTLSFPGLWFYVKVIVLNHPFITAAYVLLVGYGLTFRRLYAATWFQAVCLAIAVHFTFFASSQGFVPRYSMPIVLFMILSVGGVVAMEWDRIKAIRPFMVAIVGLTVAAFLFQSANDIQWMRLASAKPVEMKAAEYVRSLPQGTSVLFVGRLLPAWHDSASFLAYASSCLPYESDLYPYMASLPAPDGQKPLSMTYWCKDAAPPAEVTDAYDVVIRPEGEFMDSAYFEERIVRLWQWDTYGLRYRAQDDTEIR
ncbi:MAG: hypothetical protein V1745_00835, partial [Patescibacteria group bacterium]